MAALAGIVLTALNLRSAVTAVPPLLDRISTDLGFTATMIGLLGAIPALAFSAAGLVGIRLLRRFSAERIAVGVLLVEATGQMLRPWSGGSAGFLVVTVLTLLGMGVGNVILPALVKAWFPDRIGMVTAAYVMAVAVGTSVPALVAVPIAAGLGWKLSLALWGALALLPVPAWLIAARMPRVLPPTTVQRQSIEDDDQLLVDVNRQSVEDGDQLRVDVNKQPVEDDDRPRVGVNKQQVGDDDRRRVGVNKQQVGDDDRRRVGVNRQQVGDDDRPRRLAVHRSPIAWGLALLFGMNALNLYAMFTWLPVRLVDAGGSETWAGAMLALFAVVGVVPGLLIPMLLGRVGRAGLMTLACVVFFALGYTGLLLAPMTLTTVWVVLAGLGGGGFPLALTLFGLRSGTPAAAGALAGFAQGVGYLVAASGPVLVGLLRELTGGWTAPFGFLGFTLLLMLAGGWLCSGTGTVDGAQAA